VCLCAALNSAGWAEEKKKEEKPASGDKAADTKIYDGLRTVINTGADLYNIDRDYAGCCRYYEGALTAYRPLLAHRKNLQDAIDAGIAKARTTPSLTDRAFVLRGVIDQIRTETNPNPSAPPATKKLWDRLGGEAGVKKVVDDFVATAAKDPKVDFTRGGKYKLDEKAVEKLKTDLVGLISSVSGGPLPYKGRSMKEIHKGMEITNAQFDATAKHLEAALKKNGVAPDDIKAVMAVVESTRKDIVESKVELPPMPKNLYERLGKEEGIAKVVDDFVAAAAKDPKVDFDRGGKYKGDAAKLKASLVAFMAEVAGGPKNYKGGSMKDVHKGMGITNEQFDALAMHLEAALKKNRVASGDINAVMAAVDGTRKDIVEGKKPEPPETAKATLYERLGKEPGIAKVVDEFVATAAKDPKVDFDRGGKYKIDAAKLKASLVAFMAEVAGGPKNYKGGSMKDVHKGMGITNDQFDATAKHLKAALEKNGVAADDVKIVMAAVEGTRKDIVEPNKLNPEK
jgi:hemoglobin